MSRSQCVKAGTEEKLVLHLLHSFSMGDLSFVTIFLSTYRSFTSTKRVLDILTDRWEGLIFGGVEAKVVSERWAFSKIKKVFKKVEIHAVRVKMMI